MGAFLVLCLDDMYAFFNKELWKCNRRGNRENRTGYQVTNQVGRSVSNVRYTEIYVIYNIIISRKLYLANLRSWRS